MSTSTSNARNVVERSPVFGGRFLRTDEQLGVGSFKTVWRAYDAKTARNVAWYNVDIRKLPPVFRKRVSEEVRLLKQVDHPNIIRFDGAWESSDGNSVVFITEIVTSGTLKEYIGNIRKQTHEVNLNFEKDLGGSCGRKRFEFRYNVGQDEPIKVANEMVKDGLIREKHLQDMADTITQEMAKYKPVHVGQNFIRLEVIRRWCRQILSGLHHLHSYTPPIIHRDLKCDNIFINGTKGDLRIGDLGLSTQLARGPKTKSVVGTPEFMAPEMYEEAYDEKVDIYAFGMCVLEMLTNDTPYRECVNVVQIYRTVTAKKLPQLLRDKVDGEPADYELARGLVQRLLVSAPAERPSAAELLEHKLFRKPGADSAKQTQTTKPVQPTRSESPRAQPDNDVALAPSRNAGHTTTPATDAHKAAAKPLPTNLAPVPSVSTPPVPAQRQTRVDGKTDPEIPTKLKQLIKDITHENQTKQVTDILARLPTRHKAYSESDTCNWWLSKLKELKRSWAAYKMQLDNHKQSRNMRIAHHTTEMEKLAKERASIEARQRQIREQERKEIEELQGEQARALHQRRQLWEASFHTPEPPVASDTR